MTGAGRTWERTIRRMTVLARRFHSWREDDEALMALTKARLYEVSEELRRQLTDRHTRVGRKAEEVVLVYEQSPLPAFWRLTRQGR